LPSRRTQIALDSLFTDHSDFANVPSPEGNFAIQTIAAGVRIAMTLKWMPWLLCGCCLLAPTSVAADPPWSRLLSTHRVEADPEKDYQLTEDQGPWLIMAASFAGDGAERQAKDLVLEFRKRYKLSAYLHEMKFEFKEAEGRGIDRYNKPLKFRYQRDGGEQFAVLVGDFQDSSDESAQKALRRIKTMTPDAIVIQDGKPTNLQLANWREICRWESGQEAKRGPMSAAFLTANPLIPDEYFNPQGGVDPEVIEWNKPAEYSLLECPGKYTVQVATFRGKSEIRQDKVRAIEKGEADFGSSLAKSTMMAHKMAVALRAKGYEAYEFHDRYASIVTVGSFDSVGTPRADGKIEINPRLHEIMNRFKSKNSVEGAQGTAMLMPKSIIGIPFDMEPIPIHVPRPTISQAYSRKN